MICGTLTERCVHVTSNRRLVNILARILYEVVEHRVSVDVAFKRVCRKRCVEGLREREELYECSRGLISNYLKLIHCCGISANSSYRELVKLWLSSSCHNDQQGLYCIYSYPKWFVDRLLQVLSEEEVVKLLESMNRRIWWLRINTLKASEEHVLNKLEQEGIIYETFKEVPYMIKIVNSSKPVRLLSVVKEFKAVPQDLSSAVVVEALNPEVNDYILDLTAAPGMKTSLMMMLTENRAKVVACDISLRRLISMKYLLKKLGVDLTRVNIIHTDSVTMNYRYTFDKVLLDAPCSNSGAIGKDPSIKVTLTYGKVTHYSRLQVKLLSKALTLANAYVTYSTCSLLPEEGELVVSRFADRVKFVKAIGWTLGGYPIVNFSQNLMRLMPHLHGSEGFFISVLLMR